MAPTTQGPISPLYPPEARRKSSALKTWWHAFTHRKDSKDSAHDEGEETALHRLPYHPRHAARDALLSIPLAERRRTPALQDLNPTKRNSTGSLAVHPNRDISLDRLGRRGRSRSFSWSWWGSSGDGSGGSGGGGMESIREDQGAEEGGAGVVCKSAPLRTRGSFVSSSRQHNQPTASSSSGSQPWTAAPYSPRFRYAHNQLPSRSDVARQLQDRISPAERAVGDADDVVAYASSIPLPSSPGPEAEEGEEHAQDEEEGEGIDVDAWVKQLVRATAVM